MDRMDLDRLLLEILGYSGSAAVQAPVAISLVEPQQGDGKFPILEM